MEMRSQLPTSHPLTAPVHPPERVTGPPEFHHSEGHHLVCNLQLRQRERSTSLIGQAAFFSSLTRVATGHFSEGPVYV
jgi:hypothetical protein